MVTGKKYFTEDIEKTPWVHTRDLLTVDGETDAVTITRETDVTGGSIRTQRPSNLVGEEINGDKGHLEVKMGLLRRTVFRYVRD